MNQEAFDRLLSAARALIEAREDQMVTSVEWEALAEAVTAARKVQPKGKASSTRKPRGC